MVKTLCFLVLLALAPFAGAQDYQIELRAGVGDVVAPPYTRLQVAISRTDSRAFVGRVVVDLDSSGMGGRGRGRRRGPQLDIGEVSITQDVSLEEGATSRLVSLDVPVSGMLSLDVRLERRVTGDYYEEVATNQISPGSMFDPSQQLVGFVSPARLEAAQPFLFQQLVEIQVQDLPDSWKALACFDAILLNDDRLSRAQSAALADYMAAGGTVILSPSSPGSFNPETPAGSLLGIPATSQQTFQKLSDYPSIFTGKLTPSGFSSFQGNQGMPVGEGPEAPVAPGDPSMPIPTPPEQVDIPKPAEGALMRYWAENGRSKTMPETGGLVSIARVGAGNLVLLHTDISSEPFTTGGERAPTTAAVQLIELALNKLGGRTALTPMALLTDKDVRDTVDIAGHRIPGRDALVVILLLYVAVAGVGMFLLARKLRRPELYPATLLVAALVSVALVFGIGELYKRSGDRVKAVRILVSDETTDRNALFELGCAYSVQGETYDFVNSRKAALIPAKFEYYGGTARGMPSDPLDHTTNFTPGEATTHITGLDRWQNVFFARREPAQLEGFGVEVVSFPDAWRVVNKSPHELKACVFLVGGQSAGGLSCEWHYVSTIGAAGSADASITFSQSTRLSGDVEVLGQQVADDTNEFTIDVLGAMFSINPADRFGLASNYSQLEARLFAGGLRPDAGEFLLIAMLPEDALSGASIGAQGVEDDDIGQVNLWMVRGGVEGR